MFDRTKIRCPRKHGTVPGLWAVRTARGYFALFAVDGHDAAGAREKGDTVREFSIPPLVGTLRRGGLADSVFETALRDPELPQLARPGPWGTGWRTVPAAAFRDEVMALAKGLLAEGVRFGDPVAVMARTCDEWTLFGYALWALGAQVVPVYPTASPEQVRHILSSSRSRAVVVENETHAMTLGAACGGLPGLRRIWQLDTGCVARISAAGAGIGDEEVHRHRLAVAPGSPAALVYTSGTTGPARGCVITHANLAFECDTLLTGWGHLMGPPGEQPPILAFLPAAHIYGLMVTVLCVRGGILLGHQPEPAPSELLPALASFRPTCVFAVPYVFERIFSAARRTAEEAGRGRLFEQAVRVAARYAEAEEALALGSGPGPGPVLRAQHAAYDRLVYHRLRAVLGGRTRNVVSGGSTLRRELGLIFDGAGVTVYDGYGLTETTGAVTAQEPGRPRFGAVGRPMPGAAVRIARDGEVWVRGPMVFAGYVGDDGATVDGASDSTDGGRPEEDAAKDGAAPGRAADGVREEGWLATGDTGCLDEGHLFITGRKKDVIITSGGTSVTPLALEERLRAHPLISQALVVGDDRPYIAALVTLDPEALEHRLERGGRAEAGTRTERDEIRREVARAVAAANSTVSHAESIRAFRILAEEFSVGDGLMTPSLKLRRAAIVGMYAAEIEALYQD